MFDANYAVRFQMMKYLWVLGCVLLTACGSTTPSAPFIAATPPVTQAIKEPTLEPGQQWTFRRMDLWRHEEIERFHQQLVAQSAGKWQVIWTITESKDIKRRYSVTPESMSAQTQGFGSKDMVGRYDPLRFPLTVGQTWTFDYSVKPKAYPVKISQTAKVVGWEKVRTPAGTFDALKVEHQGRYSTTDGNYNWSGQIHEVFWYAPAARRIVKHDYTDTKGDGTIWDQWSDELIEIYL
jgi:hypothetical protein